MKKSWKVMATLSTAAVATAGLLSVGGAAVAQAGSQTTLKIEMFDRGNAPSGYTATNNYLTQWLQKKFGTPNGINLDYVDVPRSQEVQQVTVWMASGSDIPDLMFTYHVGTVYQFVQEGGLMDLAPLLNKYGPNLKKYLGKATLSTGVFNGKQYAIPARRVWLGKYSTFIRQDWLQKLHLKAPTNTTQLFNVLMAFKKAGLGGKNTIPFGFALTQRSYEPFIWSFVKTSPQISPERQFVNTEPDNNIAALLPGFKNALLYLNKLYNNGLISPDAALDKDGSVKQQDIANGQVGAFSYDDIGLFGSGGAIQVMEKNNPGARVEAIYPFTKEPMYLPNGMYLFVPKTTPQAQAIAAIKYLNFLAKPSTINFTMFGTKGKNYKIENGVPALLTNAATQKELFDSGDVNIVTNGVDLGSLRKNEALMVNNNPGMDKQDQATEFKALNYETLRNVQILQTPHPNEADSQYSDTLQTDYQGWIVACMEAKPSNFNATYAQWMNKYLSDGGTAVKKDQQAMWNAMTPAQRKAAAQQMKVKGFK